MACLGVALAMPGRARVGPRPVRDGGKTGYLPTLDGWRAIAILAVIIQHDTSHAVGPFSTEWLFLHGGWSGVDLFFAISGLLICSRLLEEEKIFGRISLRNFYIRRAFRILPPAFAFLGAVAILIATGVLHIGWREWLGTALFLRNYTSLLGKIGSDSYYIGHFWSLAVEEHFYLILPAVLVLTRKGWRVPILLGMSLIVAVHRFRVLEFRPWNEVLFHTDIRLDGLLIAAIFAILAQPVEIRAKMKKWLRFWPLPLIAAMILYSNWSGSFWQMTLVTLLLPMTILGTVLNPGGLLALPLEWTPVKYLGRISYSLYIWQELFFSGHSNIGFPLGILESTSLRYTATLGMAIASYHLLELPLIRLGHRLAPPATAGRGDLPEVSSNIGQYTENTVPPPEVT
jgi:peptidoglycan/LPS O-acetylase OafA/YrhL